MISLKNIKAEGQMPNIHETIVSMERINQTKIVMMKERKSFDLLAVSSKNSNTFRLIDIDLSKVPVLSAVGCEEDGPILIDMNVNKLRRTSCGFVPKIIIMAGINTLKKFKRTGDLSCSAWVGDKVLNGRIRIQADDAIGMNTLDSKLCKLIDDTYNKNSKQYNSLDGGYAYIVEIYPFENYLIFKNGGDKFRQKYTLDPILRECKLDGKPVRVFEQYVDVAESKGVKGLSSSTGIQEALLDPRNNESPALGGFNGPAMNWSNGADVLTHYGANGSETNNAMLKLMLNVEEALNMYQTETAKGIHKVIYTPYAPVPSGLINASREAKIAADVAGLDVSKFSVMDFMKWQHKKMSVKASAKTKDGLCSDDYAYVGDVNDTSTWHLKVQDAKHAKLALARFNQTQGIPKSEKASVLSKIKKIAESKGVTVTSKPTPKQKKFIKADMVQPMPAVSPSQPSNSSGMTSKGGPHLGKGKSATKAQREMEESRQ